MNEPVALAVPEHLGIDALHEVLLRDFGCEAGPEGRIERTYVDTFDWRFAKAGLAVDHERVLAAAAGEQPADPAYLRVRRRGALTSLLEAPLSVIPRLVNQIPDERLRSLLAKVAENRALLVVGRLVSEIRIYRVLDVEGKATVRVLVDEQTPVLVGAAGAGAARRTVVLTPVRGHPGEFARVRERMVELLGAGGAEVPEPADVAAVAAGYDPGIDPSEIDVELASDASADEAMRAVLSRYLQVMVANEPGVRDDLDPEFLHDFRVAIRRVRSLLNAAKDVLPEAERVALAGEFRWLGAVTTPVRDFDVLLEDLDRTAEFLPTWHSHLGPFRAVVDQWRAAARSELIAALGSDRYRVAVADAQWLATTPGGDSPPALIFVGRRIGAAAKRVRKLGRQAETAPEWHEVRKAAKKLRYLVDGFGSLYPPEAVVPAVRELKRLQTTLGELQDRAVHGELTERVARALAAQPVVSANPPVTALSLVASGALTQWHLDRGEQAYRECAASFARYDRKRVRQHFRELSWKTPGRPHGAVDVPVGDVDEEGAAQGTLALDGHPS